MILLFYHIPIGKINQSFEKTLKHYFRQLQRGLFPERPADREYGLSDFDVVSRDLINFISIYQITLVNSHEFMFFPSAVYFVFYLIQFVVEGVFSLFGYEADFSPVTVKVKNIFVWKAIGSFGVFYEKCLRIFLIDGLSDPTHDSLKLFVIHGFHEVIQCADGVAVKDVVSIAGDKDNEKILVKLSDCLRCFHAVHFFCPTGFFHFHIEKEKVNFPRMFFQPVDSTGSGKSTLLNCISAYIPFEQGSISLGDTELTELSEEALAKVRNEKLGFVFQDFMLLDGLTVRENILVPRIIRGNVDAEAEAVADNLISLFGIDHIRDKYPAEISGGERQRTAVARSLINDPYMILADEPTGNLDSKSSRKVIEAFEHAKEQMDATIFMVTHDSFAASFCDRVILLKDGAIYRQLERKNSRQDFQNLLLDAIGSMSETE